MTHTIDDLRGHLFATLEALRNKEKPMEVERAKAIADIAGVIVETAKVEVKYIDTVGGKGSGFLPAPETPGRPKAAGLLGDK